MNKWLDYHLIGRSCISEYCIAGVQSTVDCAEVILTWRELGLVFSNALSSFAQYCSTTSHGTILQECETNMNMVIMWIAVEFHDGAGCNSVNRYMSITLSHIKWIQARDIYHDVSIRIYWYHIVNSLNLNWPSISSTCHYLYTIFLWLFTIYAKHVSSLSIMLWSLLYWV